MAKARLQQIPYIENSAKLFDQIAHQPWAVFLDSTWPYLASGSVNGRYDIMTSQPTATLKTVDNVTIISRNNTKR